MKSSTRSSRAQVTWKFTWHAELQRSVVYPAIDINKSGTRREELMISQSLLQKVWILRKLLHPMDEIQAIEFMLDKLKATKSNEEFFNFMKR